MCHHLLLTMASSLLLVTALGSADEPAKPTAERIKLVREMYAKLPCDILRFAEPAKKVVKAEAYLDGGTMVLVLQDAKDKTLTIHFDGNLRSKTRGSLYLESGCLPTRSPEESAVYGLLVRFSAKPPDKTPPADLRAVEAFLTILDERFAGALPIAKEKKTGRPAGK